LLQALERPAELAVYVIDDTRPRGTRILIGRNDLVADRSQRSCFIDGQELPRSSVRAASDTRPCCGSERRLQEGTPVQFETRFHFPFVTCRGEEVCDQHHERVWTDLSRYRRGISGSQLEYDSLP
jgi:hypothetical protein